MQVHREIILKPKIVLASVLLPANGEPFPDTQPEAAMVLDGKD
jgi:hypothetical protein